MIVWDDTTRERGRPARILSLGLPLSFPAISSRVQALLRPPSLPTASVGSGRDSVP